MRISELAAGAEHLDTPIVLVGHVHPSLAAHRHPVRVTKLPVPAAFRAPLAQERALSAKHLHAVVLPVRHVNLA